MAHAGGRKGIEMTNKKCYKSYVPALPHGHRAEVLALCWATIPDASGMVSVLA
jgi:hypothetical protein